MSRNKIHYWPLVFSESKRVYCRKKIKHNLRFATVWEQVTCKNCLSAKKDDEMFARSLGKTFVLNYEPEPKVEKVEK